MSEKIRTIIVDDEPQERQHLTTLIERDPEIEIIDICANGHDAIAAIRQSKPNLIFLDVVMPRIDGFQVLEKLEPKEMPLVIFVTGYDQYAVRAFDVHAVDYLLKPYTEDRFQQAVNQAKLRLEKETQAEITARTRALIEERKNDADYFEYIPVKDHDCMVLIKTSDIDSIEARDKYVLLQIGAKEYIRREKISYIERRLDPKKFIRIHRRYIVNIDSIVRFEPMFNHEFDVLLRNKKRLRMSRDYRKQLKNRGWDL